MAVNDGGLPPILAQKHDRQRSAFASENLLREARRQERITDSSILNICVLDSDGVIVLSLLAGGEALIAIAADRLRSRLP
jgi:uridine phosphorylase